MYGNVSEIGDVGGSPGKSCLFLLTAYYPGIALCGDRVKWLVKQFASELSGALSTALENPMERLIRTPGRTHNRIRSPR